MSSNSGRTLDHAFLDKFHPSLPLKCKYQAAMAQTEVREACRQGDQIGQSFAYGAIVYVIWPDC
jgi:hypothetical protein